MLQLCLLVHCAGTLNNTLCVHACFTFGCGQKTLYTLRKPRLLTMLLMSRFDWKNLTSHISTYYQHWQPNCNMDRSLSQARCVEAVSKPQQWCCFTVHKTPEWVAVCWYMPCFYHRQGLSVLPLAPSVVPWWPSRAQFWTHSMGPFAPVASRECMVSCKVIEHTGMRERSQALHVVLRQLVWCNMYCSSCP